MSKNITCDNCDEIIYSYEGDDIQCPICKDDNDLCSECLEKHIIDMHLQDLLNCWKKYNKK